MALYVVLAVLLLLAVLPVGVSVVYREEDFRVRLKIGFLKITVFPFPKKKKKKAPEPEKKAPPKEPEQPKPEQPKEAPKPKSSRKLQDFLPFIKLALDFLGDFRRKLRVDYLELRVLLAGDDPCDLAVNYGRANAALANLIPALERAFVIRKRDMSVSCDFTAVQTVYRARLDLTITVGRIISLAAVYGVRAVREFMKMKKAKKGGADK